MLGKNPTTWAICGMVSCNAKLCGSANAFGLK